MLSLPLQNQILQHARPLCQQSRGRSVCNLVVARRKKRPWKFDAHYCKAPSFASDNLRVWNRPYSVTLSPYLVGSIRTLSNKDSRPKSTTTDPLSFYKNIYNNFNYDQFRRNLCSILRDVSLQFRVLLPRIVTFVGTLHLISEYGLKIFHCEGPSMEPTIIDGSHTTVLLDRWSHRLYGLERDVNSAYQNGIVDEENQNFHQERSEPSVDSWHALFSGIWEQHFSSGLQRGDVVILHHPLKEATICKRIIGMPGDTIVHEDGGFEDSRYPFVVPPGHLWLEGDNPPRSLDSRSYGAVPASLVIGKVICRLWPLREYVSLGLDGNGVEHWQRVSARIARGDRPLPPKITK